jgi:hypothetical protein
MDSNRSGNAVYRRALVAATLFAVTVACAASIADAAPGKSDNDVRYPFVVAADSAQVSPQAAATCSPLPSKPLRVREGTTTNVAGNWDCLESVSSDDESRAKASLVTSNSHKTLQVTGVSGGKSPAQITVTGGVNGTVEVQVRPKQAAQTAIVTAFGFSNVPVLTFNNPPANVNATPAPGTLLTTPPTTFRSLINENSGQRTGFGITALARVTDADYVNGYAMVGAFAGSNGGYIVGGGLGYKETVYLVAGAHFVSTQRLNGYTLDQAVPAGMTTIPTISRQTSGLFIGLGINIGNLTDVLSGKSSGK